MTQPELIAFCARVLLSRCDVEPADQKIVYDNLEIGLQVLANCADEWLPSRSIDAVRERIMFCLRNVHIRTQWCAARVIESLFECNDWVTHEKEVVDVGDFELSAVLWLLKVGVRKLALAIVQPRSPIDVALACEENWMLESDSEKARVQIREFVADLKTWSRSIDTALEYGGAKSN